MKVLHIFNSIMPSGAETMWAAAAPVLQEKGVESYAIATAFEFGPYVASMRAVGYHVDHLPCGTGRLGRLVYYIRLLIYLRRNKFDAVQIHPEARRFEHHCVARLAGVKRTVTTVHSVFIYSGLRAWRRRWQMRLLQKTGGVVVAIGDSVRENERRYGYEPELIYNWYDSSRFSDRLCAEDRAALRGKLGIGESQKCVVIVGNCAPVKNHDFFIRMLAQLPERYVALHVGREDEDAYHERRLAERLAVAGRVKFLGIRDDVPKLLSCADVFVMCSFREGFGLACIEALSMGVPSVVSDVIGLCDLPKHFSLCLKAPLNEHEFASQVETCVSWTGERLTYERIKTAQSIATVCDMRINVSRYMDLWFQ